MNRLFIRRPGYMAYNVGYGSTDVIVTGSEGWADYTWNKTTGVITYKVRSSGDTATVKSGTTSYNDITTKVTNWTPVAPQATTASTSTTETPQQESNGNGFFDTLFSNIITGYDPQSQLPPVAVTDSGSQTAQKAGLPQWVLPAVGVGVAGLVIVLLVSGKK
jgi:hypothetical protein